MALDLKLKFTMLSITYLKREGQHKILEKVSTDEKLRNLLQFNPFLFITILFPYLLKSPPGKNRSKQMCADTTYFLQERKSSSNL